MDKRSPRTVAPLAAGLAVTAGAIAAGPFTGAGLNPARWLGPALAAKSFDNWPVWVAGPVLGGLLGALVYENFLADRTAADEPVAGGEVAGTAGEGAAVSRALPAGSAPAEPIVPGKATAGSAGTTISSGDDTAR
jgi:hypothetical protein